MHSKVILTCAITGAVHIPSMSPHLPITPEQIVNEAVAACNAGAAVVHLHARDPQTGRPSSDTGLMKEIVDGVRARCDVVIGITTGGAIGMSIEERLASVPICRAELASCNAGSTNFCFSGIADKIKDYLLEQGVKSALINLGGNVLCIGEKPDGLPFKVGLQKPFKDRNETIAVLNIRDRSVVTSGVYERCFEKDGVNYHHILDPKTGYPYDNGLLSVTIVSPRSVDGDGLSTACFSLGLKEGIALLDTMPEVCGYFITEDYKVHYSEGAKELLQP